MSGPTRTLAYVAAAVPALLMGALVGVVLLFGGGGGAAVAVASCDASPSAAGDPPLMQDYLGAAARYHLSGSGYAYLAAINKVETGFGTDLANSSAGAVGWMQFEPATFAQYGVSVSDPSAPADPANPDDAIYTAARYLHASGAPGNWSAAIYAYNHSNAYVTDVESTAALYLGANGLAALRAAISSYWGSAQQPQASTPAISPLTVGGTSEEVADSLQSCATGTSAGVDDVAPVNGSEGVLMPNGLARPGKKAPENVQAMVAAGDRITSMYYSWGGGYCTAAMNQSSPDVDACPGDQRDGGPGYDCASSTSYVLWGGGYAPELGNAVLSSIPLESVGVTGVDPQGWVTWWASTGHAFIEVDGLVLDTVPGVTMVSPAGAPSTGPRWHTSAEVQFELDDDKSVGEFHARHPASI
jgi:hypothetical protein